MSIRFHGKTTHTVALWKVIKRQRLVNDLDSQPSYWLILRTLNTTREMLPRRTRDGTQRCDDDDDQYTINQSLWVAARTAGSRRFLAKRNSSQTSHKNHAVRQPRILSTNHTQPAAVQFTKSISAHLGKFPLHRIHHTAIQEIEHTSVRSLLI